MYQKSIREEHKHISTSELDNMSELMSGILTNPKEFIQEDGKIRRWTMEDPLWESQGWREDFGAANQQSHYEYEQTSHL